MTHRKDLDEDAWREILLDWLATDDIVAPAERTAYIPKDLERVSASDRQVILNWLDLPLPEPDPKSLADPTRQAAVAWLLQCRAILASERLSIQDKLTKLRRIPLRASTLALIRPLGSRSGSPGYQAAAQVRHAQRSGQAPGTLARALTDRIRAARLEPLRRDRDDRLGHTSRGRCRH